MYVASLLKRLCFSGDVETGYSETSEPSPINIYGQSKLKGEKELISLSGKGLQWYVIRTARLFGTKGSGENAKPTFLNKCSKFQNEKQLSQ